MALADVHHVKSPSEGYIVPEEFSGSGSQFQDAAGQSLAFHQRRGVYQFVALQVAAGDAHWARSLTGRDDDTDAAVATSAHRSAASINHKADQKPAKGEQKPTSQSIQQRLPFPFRVVCCVVALTIALPIINRAHKTHTHNSTLKADDPPPPDIRSVGIETQYPTVTAVTTETTQLLL